MTNSPSSQASPEIFDAMRHKIAVNLESASKLLSMTHAHPHHVSAAALIDDAVCGLKHDLDRLERLFKAKDQKINFLTLQNVELNAKLSEQTNTVAKETIEEIKNQSEIELPEEAKIDEETAISVLNTSFSSDITNA